MPGHGANGGKTFVAGVVQLLAKGMHGDDAGRFEIVDCMLCPAFGFIDGVQARQNLAGFGIVVADALNKLSRLEIISVCQFKRTTPVAFIFP